MSKIATVEEFAKIVYDILKSDRDVNMGVGGFTGEGKSTFSTLLQKKFAEISGSPWGFDRMTWSRKELMMWIDGDKDPKSDKPSLPGLKPGQLPEYSAILPDELFAMFYRRNWFDGGQIDAISTFNMCRDRHIFLCGNVPNFWDLDTAFTSRIRFYAFIVRRGTAWVFQQENNPFSTDPWNAQENKRLFRKSKNPYKIANFVCEIHFPDWNPQEKEEYLRIRNQKRLLANVDNKDEKMERYSTIKSQRDICIKYILANNKKIINITNKELAELIDMSPRIIGYIRDGAR